MNDLKHLSLLSLSGDIIKGHEIKIKVWLYSKVFHEEFKSLDYNTVKRKLSDLRKSLELSINIPKNKKEKSNTKKISSHQVKSQSLINSSPCNSLNVQSNSTFASTFQLQKDSENKRYPILQPSQLETVNISLINNSSNNESTKSLDQILPNAQPLNLQIYTSNNTECLSQISNYNICNPQSNIKVDTLNNSNSYMSNLLTVPMNSNVHNSQTLITIPNHSNSCQIFQPSAIFATVVNKPIHQQLLTHEQQTMQIIQPKANELVTTISPNNFIYTHRTAAIEAVQQNPVGSLITIVCSMIQLFPSTTVTV